MRVRPLDNQEVPVEFAREFVELNHLDSDQCIAYLINKILLTDVDSESALAAVIPDVRRLILVFQSLQYPICHKMGTGNLAICDAHFDGNFEELFLAIEARWEMVNKIGQLVTKNEAPKGFTVDQAVSVLKETQAAVYLMICYFYTLLPIEDELEWTGIVLDESYEQRY